MNRARFYAVLMSALAFGGVPVRAQVPPIDVTATLTVSEFQPEIRWSGRVNAIAVHPMREEVFVTTESGGLFRSRDGGDTWVHVDSLPPFFTRDVAYAPNNPEVLVVTAIRDYAVRRWVKAGTTDVVTTSNGGIWVSRDGGETWFMPPTGIPRLNQKFSEGKCPENVSAYGMSVDPETNRIYVATDCGVSMSADDGVTWAHFELPYTREPDKRRQVIFAAVAALGNGGAIAGGGAGVFYSPDGVNWAREETGIGTVDYRDIHAIGAVRGVDDPAAAGSAFLLNKLNRLWRTRDGGRTWRREYSPAPDDGCGGIAFVKSAPGFPFFRVYLGNKCEAYQRSAQFGLGGRFTWVDRWSRFLRFHGDARDLVVGVDRFGDADPVFLANDGGLERRLGGRVFGSIGTSGPGGINALQVTEVTGQRIGDELSTLIFGTQDNDLWASSDVGATWRVFDRYEGFSIELERAVETVDESRITYKACAACVTKLREPPFILDWLDPVDPDKSEPVLVDRAIYLQHEEKTGGMYLTRNSGSSWDQIAFFNTAFRDGPKVAGPKADPVAYQADRVAGNLNEELFDGTRSFPRVKLVRMTDFIDGGSATLRRPTMAIDNGTGVPQPFGSIGVMPTMFAWYWVFAVDPQDPMHLILPDKRNGMVESWNGGESWTLMPDLARLVGRGGTLAFVDKDPYFVQYFTLVSAIEFNPEYPNFVLLGARQGGAYFSSDRGRQWTHIKGSERIVNITSFHWRSLNDVVLSSYGRGLWKIGIRVSVALKRFSDLCLGCRLLPFAPPEPGGGALPSFGIADEHDLPFDEAFLVLDGRVLDAKFEKGVLTEVILSPEASQVVFRNGGLGPASAGSLKEQTTATSPLPGAAPPIGIEPPFSKGPVNQAALTPWPIVKESIGRSMNLGALERRVGITDKTHVIVGFTSLGGRVNQVIVAEKELPIPAPGPVVPFENTGKPPQIDDKPYIRLSAQSSVRGLPVLRPEGDGLTVEGRGFDPSRPVEILIDGGRRTAKVGRDGQFVATLRLSLVEGSYQLLVRQQGAQQQVLFDAGTFLVQHVDEPTKRRRRPRKKRRR